ncbi:hypothetical protein A2U01_0095757, partial [Trifolium medium]|nr:hypothetical protein [Trifolium medium]
GGLVTEPPSLSISPESNFPGAHPNRSEHGACSDAN